MGPAVHFVEEVGVSVLTAVVHGYQFREGGEMRLAGFAGVDIVSVQVLEEEEGHASVSLY